MIFYLHSRVNLTVVRVAPGSVAGSMTTVQIQFSEAMDQASVKSRLFFEPPIAGTITWGGTTLLFRPEGPLPLGQSYTITLNKGVKSNAGHELMSPYTFTFKVMRPRVAFLAPSDSTPQNIWIAAQDDVTHPKQVTFAPAGVYDFGISPDGSQIAFAERKSGSQTSDIRLLDLASGAVTDLTKCDGADCMTPVWRPDGKVIAYERVEVNSALSDDDNPPRVWLLDLSASPPATRPLFSDMQMVGYGAEWSADGGKIAVFNRDQGILVYDFKTGTALAVPSNSGITGALSPDGTQLIFPDMLLKEGPEPVAFLRIANLTNNTIAALTNPSEPVRNDSVEWRPDGKMLAVARRYLDNRYTHGFQIYLMSPDGSTVTPVTDDSRYANAFFTWSPLGDQLLIQRFQEFDDSSQPKTDSRPEIWAYDVSTHALAKIASNVYHPRWVP